MSKRSNACVEAPVRAQSSRVGPSYLVPSSVIPPPILQMGFRYDF